jgi:hypothetical protein
LQINLSLSVLEFDVQSGDTMSVAIGVALLEDHHSPTALAKLALVARDPAGSLPLQSEGPNRGILFTVNFPQTAGIIQESV